MLYQFTLVVYAGGKDPADAFANMLEELQTTGLSIDDEVVFEEIPVEGQVSNLAIKKK